MVFWCWLGNVEGCIEDVENIGLVMFVVWGLVCEDVVYLLFGENVLEI